MINVNERTKWHRFVCIQHYPSSHTFTSKFLGKMLCIDATHRWNDLYSTIVVVVRLAHWRVLFKSLATCLVLTFEITGFFPIRIHSCVHPSPVCLTKVWECLCYSLVACLPIFSPCHSVYACLSLVLYSITCVFWSPIRQEKEIFGSLLSILSYTLPDNYGISWCHQNCCVRGNFNFVTIWIHSIGMYTISWPDELLLGPWNG